MNSLELKQCYFYIGFDVNIEFINLMNVLWVKHVLRFHFCGRGIE